MRKIAIPGDGSCYFHCLLEATDESYRQCRDCCKKRKVAELRARLADELPKAYQNLSRGELSKFPYSEYELSAMVRNLRDYHYWPDNVYQEFISNELGIDIYIFDTSGALVPTAQDNDLLHLGRPSVFLCFSGNHYDIFASGDVVLFPADHPEVLKARGSS